MKPVGIEQIAQVKVKAAGRRVEIPGRVKGKAAAAPTAGLSFRFLDAVGLHPAVAVLIVLAPLFPVRQHLVGRVNFLELFLGLGIPRVHIRVILTGQPAVSLPNLLVPGIPAHPQQVIVVRRHSDTPVSI